MAKMLENLHALSRTQDQLPFEKPKRGKTKPPTRLNNDEWNLLVQRLFSGDDPKDLSKKFNVSVKTIYGWRRRIMLHVPISRFTLSEDTKKVLKRSRLSWFDENGVWRTFVYREKFSQILMDQIVDQIVNPEPEIIKQPSQTLLVAPSGNQLFVKNSDAALMAFLKKEGFELYQLVRKV